MPSSAMDDNNEPNQNETAAAIGKASKASEQITEPSTSQQKLDKLEDHVFNLTGSAYSSASKQFYSDNTSLFTSSAQEIAGTSEWNTIEENISGFAESSKLLISLLDEVAKIHPFVAIAVLAFKGVVSLELKRRDNDQKVIALKLQMQEMMAVLLQLRNIKGTSQKASDGILLKDRMSSLMRKIAKDIESCGNVCDTYSKKNILVKVLKGPIYANRLADFASVFQDRQKDIRMALLLHTATRLDSVMDTLSDVDQNVKSTGEKLNMMALFRKLDSLQEKELMKLIQAKGGALKCMEDDSALAELIFARNKLDQDQRQVESERTGSRMDSFPSDQERHHSKSYNMRIPRPSSIHVHNRSYVRPSEGVPGTRIHSQPRRQQSYHPMNFSDYPNRSNVRPLEEVPAPRIHSQPRRQQSYHPMNFSDYPNRSNVRPPEEVPAPRIHSQPRRQRSYHSPNYVYPADQSGYPMNFSDYPNQLHDQSGDPFPDEPASDDGDLVALKKELHEDVDKSFEKNMVVFQRKLDVQRRQIAAAISDLWYGKDLRNIWKDMGWKGSVKARDFVFALHEYFMEKLHGTDPLHVFLTSTTSQTSEAFQLARKIANKKADDLQALEYINMRNIQPILEAFDDDGSGFVTIREVNQFASTRPRDWSLQQWISFWAVGWHFVVWEYRSKLCGIILNIFRDRDHLLPPNRSLVDEYLNNLVLDILTDLLGPVQPFKSKLDDNFRTKTLKYAQEEEARIESNLQLMAYEIDAPSTLMLVTGPGRIERYIFPLLFLILRHHSRIIRLASHVLIDREELKTATRTLEQVINIAYGRVEILDAIFRQKYGFVEPGNNLLDRFAFSMFSKFVEPDTIIPPLDDPYLDGAYTDILHADQLDGSILKYPPLEGFDHADYVTYASNKTTSRPVSSPLSINGTWSGFCSSNGVLDTCGLIQFSITTTTEYGSFHGSGVDAMGSFAVNGKYLQDHLFETIFTRESRPTHYDSICPTYFVGKRDMVSRTINGEWGTERGTTVGTMILHPIPASLCRFRPQGEDNLNIARARWVSAVAAVLDEVRRRLWSWPFFKARCATRKHYTELYRRRYLSDFLNDGESKALVTYERNLLPEDIRFYRSIARSYYGRCIHFDVICGLCNSRIVGSRVISLTIGYGDAAENFCISCFRRDQRFSGLIIQCTRAVHHRELASLLSSAYKAWHETLDIFETMDIFKVGSYTCSSCHQVVGGGDWVCVYCRKPEIFVCDECNIGNRGSGNRDTVHTDSHPLIQFFPVVSPSWRAVMERNKSPKYPIRKKLWSLLQRMSGRNISSNSSRSLFGRPYATVIPPSPVSSIERSGRNRRRQVEFGVIEQQGGSQLDRRPLEYEEDFVRV